MKGYKRLIDEYFERCMGEEREGKNGENIRVNSKPPTLTGLALALGFNSKAELMKFGRSKRGKELVENARLKIENYNEEKLFEKDFARSAIFNLTNAREDQAAEEERETGMKIPAELVGSAFVDLYRDIAAEGHGEYVLKGGRGSTKSSFVALVIIERLMRREDEHAAAMRQVGATLRDSVYARLCWAINVLGLENEFECRLMPPEIIRKSTKQKIYFRGADDPSKLKSLTPSFGHIGMLWLEELDQFGGEAQVRSIEQSLLRGGEGLVFKTFNPPLSRNNWANRYAAMPKKNRMVHHSTYLDVPAQWLGSRFIEEAEFLKETNPTAYAHEYLGECVDCGGLVFENLTVRDISDEEISGFERIYNGIDWGWYPDPFRFCRCAYIAGERRLFIFDEISGNKLSNGDIAERLREKGIGGGDRITADSAGEGPKSIEDLKSAGFMIRGAVKGPGSVEYSMKWLCGLREIVVDGRRCPNAAREFAEYEFERDRDGQVMGGYPDRDNHSIDAVRYAMEEVWRKRGIK